MVKFNGTIEYTSKGNAIVTLYDETGEWSGGGLVQVMSSSKQDLYEHGYAVASLSAKNKGGRLETFKEVGDQKHG